MQWQGRMISTRSTVMVQLLALAWKRGRARPTNSPDRVARERERKRIWKDEKKRQEEQAKKEKVRNALDPHKPVPQNKAWRKLLIQKKELENELRNAPTADIAARIVEKAALVYKAIEIIAP